jgi:hypothetical protein
VESLSEKTGFLVLYGFDKSKLPEAHRASSS